MTGERENKTVMNITIHSNGSKTYRSLIINFNMFFLMINFTFIIWPACSSRCEGLLNTFLLSTRGFRIMISGLQSRPSCAISFTENSFTAWTVKGRMAV